MMGLLVLKINSVYLEFYFNCLDYFDCSFCCDGNCKGYSSGWKTVYYGNRTFPSPGSVCKLNFNKRNTEMAGPLLLKINYVYIDGFYSNNINSIQGLIMWAKYNNTLGGFLGELGHSYYSFKIPEKFPLNNNDYTLYPRMSCSIISKIITYDKINQKETFYFAHDMNYYYNFTKVTLKEEEEFFGKIDYYEVDPDQKNTYLPDSSKTKGYNDFITYTVLRYNGFRDCSRRIEITICRENCTGCNKANFCTSCLNNYALFERRKCIKNSDVYNYYYISGKVIYPCFASCEKCDNGPKENHHNCKVCKKEYEYFQIFPDGTRNCYNKPCISYGLLQNEGSKECFDKCPNITDGNLCTSRCREGTFLDKATKTCLSNCGPSFFNFNKTCVTKCPTSYFYSEEDRLCIKDCREMGYHLHDKNGKCLKDCSGYGFQLNNLCIYGCPENYTSLNRVNGVVNCSFILDQIDKNSDEFKEVLYSKESILKILTKYPEEFLGKIYKISGEDYYMETFSVKNPPKINSKTSSIDLSKIVEEIAKKNSISTEEIIIIKIDTIDLNSNVNKVSFQFFSNDGKNLTENKPIKYRGSFPFKNEDKEEMEMWENMKERNFDIYDSEDKLFNEVCLSYSVEGMDLTIDDRIRYYYKNVSLCQEGCIYESLDYEAKRVNCECGGQSPPTKKFPTLTSNFELFKCYKWLTDIKMLKKNILFFTSLTQFASLTSVVLYSLIDGVKIKASILNIISTCENPPQSDVSRKNKNEEELYEISGRESSSRTINKENSVKKYGDINDPILYNVYNVNNLPFEKAKKSDNRSFIEMFCYIFLTKQIFLRLFFPLSKFESKSFNLSLAFFLFSLLFEINILFYSSGFISDVFKNRTKILFNDILLKSFYSLIVEIFVFKIFLFFSNDSYYLQTPLIEIKDKDILYQFIDSRLRKRKRKNTLFFTLFMVLSAYFLFHLSIFSAAYPNTQKYLFIQSWSTLILSFIFYFVFSLFLAILRWLGLRLNCSLLYYFSFFFNYF